MEFQNISLLHSLDFFGEVSSCLFKIQPWAAIQTFTNYLVIWAVIFCLTFLWTSIVLKLFQHGLSRLYIYMYVYIYIYQRRQWHPTPVLLPGQSHGWMSLVGCSPWGRWESDMTERLHFYFSLSCTGEGNDNPPQCSCLENPRNGGAWWAAISGVAQSRTRLKWLSSIYIYIYTYICVCVI